MNRNRLTSGQRVVKGISGTLFAFVLLLLYAPFAVMISLSFQERGTAVFPPTEFSTISYQKLFEPSNYSLFTIAGEPLTNYFPPLRLSLLLGLLTALLATVFALMAALAFRRAFRGRGPLFYVLLLGMLTPGVILGLGMRLFADEVGLDAHWYTTGLLLHVAWTMPFGFIVFLIFLNRYDDSVEEAAASLGASRWTVFRTITLPLLAPGVMGSLLFGFTLSLDEVQRSSFVMGNDQTLPMELLAVTGVRITPVVYALGSLIAVASFAFLALYFVGFERERRRTALIAPDEDDDFTLAPPTAPAAAA
ncbi:ABC transporter permease [Conexibacter sp. CPCC 206217]|uniref:ABC transporter permease n=1 Tax=Conexibacter sp. CPCC 206217 TaxID=3064574 RepID=UPI002722C5E6|nr:ABC transporter permease subunit [Conexibacter sp. CPCC 206217]MDO8211742.1 ABC transporter permease subunit [Conexibacter sp. CPCC 206217]